MATQNLSLYHADSLPAAGDMVFDIVVSQWNDQVTGALCQGAEEFLLEHGVSRENIRVYPVPGSFELVYAASCLMQKSLHPVAGQRPADAIIVLGCVVRGGTPHFDYVCQGVTQGIAQLNAQGGLPVIFGLLTTDDMQQSLDRAGGCLGNKGVEAAQTAVRMVAFKRGL